MVICLIVAGKLFHTSGPATAKLPSPRVVRVRGTESVLMSYQWQSRNCRQARTELSSTVEEKCLLSPSGRVVQPAVVSVSNLC